MCVCVVVIVHWHCSAQLSMFNMEKCYRNKIIIIIIKPCSLIYSVHEDTNKPMNVKLGAEPSEEETLRASVQQGEQQWGRGQAVCP